jgi:membrane-associated protease RseP (regulator of RpoE activity)
MELVSQFLEKGFWVLAVVNLIVFLHILGRAVSAKILGLSILKLELGVGSKALWEGNISEVLLRVAKFPLGGWISLEGETQSLARDQQGPGFLKTILGYLGGPGFQFLGVIFFLALSFIWYGDTSYTMQVVNTLEESPARKAGFQRGDIILRVSNIEVVRFEMGQRLIASYPGQEISVTVERKTGYRSFHDFQNLMAFIDKSYGNRNYIRIYGKDGGKPSVFYAREPALERLRQVDLRDLNVEVSTAKQEFEVRVTPNEYGRIGIGIKPYSLDEKTVFPGAVRSLSLAIDYSVILASEFLSELYNMAINFVQLGNMPLELNILFEILHFVVDFSELDGDDFLKLMAMLTLACALLNLLPLPRSVGFLILSGLFRRSVNMTFRRLLRKGHDLIDDELEGYMRWLYGTGFALVLILFIFHSFPSISG